MHPPKMTLHLLSSKGGAFVLKLGLVFKKKAHPNGVGFFDEEVGFERPLRKGSKENSIPFSIAISLIT